MQHVSMKHGAYRIRGGAEPASPSCNAGQVGLDSRHGCREVRLNSEQPLRKLPHSCSCPHPQHDNPGGQAQGSFQLAAQVLCVGSNDGLQIGGVQEPHSDQGCMQATRLPGSQPSAVCLHAGLKAVGLLLGPGGPPAVT